MTNQNRFFENVQIYNNKYQIQYSVLLLVLCWSTFSNDYSLESSWVWRYKLCTPIFGEFLLCISSQALRHCTAIFRSFQSCPGSEWATQGHSETCSRSHSCVVLAVCLGLLSCWKVNRHSVLGPERSGEGFHQGSVCTLLCSFLLRSWLVSQSLPLKNIPTAWCCHHHAGMVPGFLQMWRLAFRPKSSILVSSDQRILFLMVWESLGAFWQTPSGLSCAFYWGHSTIKAWLVECCRDGCPSGRFSHRHRGTLELHWVLGHLPDQDPSPPIAQFGQAASSRKSLGDSKFLPL